VRVVIVRALDERSLAAARRLPSRSRGRQRSRRIVALRSPAEAGRMRFRRTLMQRRCGRSAPVTTKRAMASRADRSRRRHSTRTPFSTGLQDVCWIARVCVVARRRAQRAAEPSGVLSRRSSWPPNQWTRNAINDSDHGVLVGVGTARRKRRFRATPFRHQGLDALYPANSALPNEHVDPAPGR
jgi:hypothetical protein